MKELLCVFVALMFVSFVTANTPCNLGAQCSHDEACVSNYHLDGKRAFYGHCMAMGTVGSTCLATYGTVKSQPPAVVIRAPCLPGLLCKPNGVFEIPYGEGGICVHM